MEPTQAPGPGEGQIEATPGFDVEAAGGLRLPGAVSVPVPWHGTNYVCPNCEYEIPTRRLRSKTRPPKYAHALNAIFQCPECRWYFSPKSQATAITG